MKWVITGDYVHNEERDFTTYTEEGRNDSRIKFKSPKCLWDYAEPLEFEFQLVDADGEAYFIGYCSDPDDVDVFAPLDIVGEKYGCVAMEVMTNGKWEQL